MSCAFDLDHYRELLEAAQAGGYRFAFFEGEPRDGDLILRHDVDLSLDAALRMAELEADAGAAATYFLMTRSIFYNLGSHEGERALGRLRELGHRVGLHAVYPRLDLDDRFDPVIAWHNPDPEYMRSPVEGVINVMEAALVRSRDLSLGLEPALALGLPARGAAQRCVPLAAAADAPRDLGLPGHADGRDDARDARGGEGAPPRAARRRQNRSLMKDVTVLVSASGAPGTAALLKGLRANGERTVRLVGTDMSERSVGRHLCDAFHRVPAGSDPAFADAVLDVVERESVDVVLPQSSFDLEGLAAHRDRFPVPVLVSSPDTIHRSNDKAETYALLQRLGVKGPDFRRVNGAHEVEAAARELGYPDRPVCFKPVFSSGSRGFRVLDPTVDRSHQLLHERPGAVAMRLEEAVELLPDEGGPDLLVMELATGGERTIDGIADGKRVVLGHPKTREAMRAGLAMYFVTLDDDELMETADKLVAELAIEWFFNIQLVGEHVIEINPRISTIVYQDDLNLPYLGVKRALGEISDEELAALRSRIQPGRTSLRYFDQVDFDGPVVDSRAHARG